MFLVKRFSQKVALLLIVLTILAAIPSLCWASAEVPSTQLNYLALGDSLAAGQTPFPEVVNGEDVDTFAKGYPDFIADKLSDDGRLGIFEKRYAVSGYTTANVLTDIQANVSRDLPGSPDLLGIRASIAQANIITLDAGANDLLRTLRHADGLYITPSEFNELIIQLTINLSGIMREIRTLNPQAQVYLMGYYNAFPYLPQELQDQMFPVLEYVNKTIQQVAVQSGATYVPTVDVIDKHLYKYLPNQTNIHPNEQGYQAIAKAFWGYLKFDLP